MNFLKYISFVLLLVLFSCASDGYNKTPENMISEEKFIDLMVEMHLIEANINQRFVKLVDSTDTSFGYYRYLFDKYEVKKVDFDSTFNYYSRNPDKLDMVYDQVQERLKAMADDLQNNEEKYMKEEAEINISKDSIAE